jgi:hypothetical protein
MCCEPNQFESNCEKIEFCFHKVLCGEKINTGYFEIKIKNLP